MSDSLVIVGLPRKEEEVNKVSSEKAAHVTILFLGEADGISEDIVGYVEHAVETAFQPIYLEVSDRGTLGPDDADVLFFAGPGARQLEAFRSLLLKDHNIRRLYDEAEQYPSFTPHLTLGYPETPANPSEHPWGIHGVEIDRIAIWWGDSEGPEFKVPYKEYVSDSVGWSDDRKDGSLWHYGKKGMKWGVITEKDGAGSDRTPTRAEKKEAKAKAADDAIASILDEHSSVKPSSAKSYSDAADKVRSEVTPAQARKNMADNQKKFADKFDPPDGGGLSSTQKQILVGAGVIGLIGAGYYVNSRMGGKSAFGIPDPGGSWSVASNLKTLKPGDPISPKDFNKAMAQSKSTWGSGFITPKSFEREAFELPVGHTFNRLSTAAETKFGDATYSTHNVEDFKRYVHGFAPEISYSGKGLNHITFQATEPIKVPNLKDTLDAMKTSMGKDPAWAGRTIEDHHVIREYQNLSGGSWKSPQAKSLFETLSERGFGAIVDEMDAGVIGETPIVLFSKAVTPKQSKKLSAGEIKKMQNSLTEFAGRKP